MVRADVSWRVNQEGTEQSFLGIGMNMHEPKHHQSFLQGQEWHSAHTHTDLRRRSFVSTSSSALNPNSTFQSLHHPPLSAALRPPAPWANGGLKSRMSPICRWRGSWRSCRRGTDGRRPLEPVEQSRRAPPCGGFWVWFLGQQGQSQ